MSDLHARAATGTLESPAGARYAVIASRWNAPVVDALVKGALAALSAHAVPVANIAVWRVPGAWEIPALAARLAARQTFSAIIALGCVVRGETRHYEHIADGCAEGLMQVATQHALPVLNGVLAVEKLADAEARAGGRVGNKGEEAALAAIELAALWAMT
ncbi:MAG TPA: 6,7-dimethyl-8-ribityllumazine synthase [Rhodanobacteraceae bacterium]|nr:6,7-dimethyl-8-ribityllumazine synthase [Rhodanobacteraceae bacterium]